MAHVFCVRVVGHPQHPHPLNPLTWPHRILQRGVVDAAILRQVHVPKGHAPVSQRANATAVVVAVATIPRPPFPRPDHFLQRVVWCSRRRQQFVAGAQGAEQGGGDGVGA